MWEDDRSGLDPFFEEEAIGNPPSPPKMGEKHKLVILTGAPCKCAEYIN